MTKLTQIQHDLLRAAADADDGAIDAPDGRKTVTALIKKGLVISNPQAEGPSRLLITEAGRAAIASEGPEPASPPETVATPPPTLPPTPAPAPKGKIGLLVEMLRRPEGATVEAMMVVTGWQAHSVRGAMSGSVKKALGLTIASEKTDAGRVYRIIDGAAA